jgi:hypothetical protein
MKRCAEVHSVVLQGFNIILKQPSSSKNLSPQGLCFYSTLLLDLHHVEAPNLCSHVSEEILSFCDMGFATLTVLFPKLQKDFFMHSI